MIPRIRIFFFLIVLIMLPVMSMASAPNATFTWRVKIHLVNGKELNGYIESRRSFKNINDPAEWNSYLEWGKKYKQQVRFIEELIEVQFTRYINNEWRKFSQPVAAKSFVKDINLTDIKSIEGISSKWNNYMAEDRVKIISDSMATYISNHKIIASYVYTDEEKAKDTGKPCELCSCNLKFISYNPEYTRERLKKQRYELYKIPNDILEKEGILRYKDCWD